MRWWKGFQRVFVVLSLAWLLTCTVGFPLYIQITEAEKAQKLWEQELQQCTQDEISGIHDGPQTKDCLEDANRFHDHSLEANRLGHFGKLDKEMGSILGLIIVIPLALLYGVALVVRWIVKGFNPATSTTV